MPRAKLLQFVAPNDGPAVWLPATEGLWEWYEMYWFERLESDPSPSLLLVRGLGPREDNALCMPVTRADDGSLVADVSQGAAGKVKSCRELPIGYWTFIRPLQEGDPEIPGA